MKKTSKKNIRKANKPGSKSLKAAKKALKQLGIGPEHELYKKHQQGVKIDLGCGALKQKGFIGVDIRKLPGVDIVQDLELFPWKIPSECASLVMTSHLIEHIDPHAPDARIAPLIDLLIKNGVITKKQVAKVIGDTRPGPLFMRFMDEVWRILKPGGQFMSALPYGTSSGYFQDPTHCNQVIESDWEYFDPEQNPLLWGIYKPKPWKIVSVSYSVNGNMEVLLEKRAEV